MVRKEKIESQEGVIIQTATDLLRLAALNAASDIHLEPEDKILRIRLRVDGVMRELETHEISMHSPLLSRFKVMAGLDIAESRKPQDGRFNTSLDGKQYDVRVSTFPTIYGENMVLRLLDKSRVLMGLEYLGFAQDQLEEWEKLIHQPYGILFVSGPNGSGKTTSLYATLNAINSPDKTIVTLEDPVEYQLPMIRQTQAGGDISFANGLRSLLRQDPDIILVGEIRDRDTAEIAIRAALTGHLVLTTIHTNDAVGAITRLVDMGIERVLIASATIGVMAQRLVRVLDDETKESYDAPDEIVKELGLPAGKPVQLYRPSPDATRAEGGGYSGRSGLFELFKVDKNIRNMIIAGSPGQEMLQYAKEKGMLTLRQDGIAKAMAGMTSIEEVLRVTTGIDVH
ncbi:MAG: GspE/PulE family protein [Patescibacteria group bacterium]|jgi:type II secretory ATPase GspE/PulE/Tfp pilus assembly ATPase PilB-like protein